jgi:hypothetical protein
MCSRPCAVRHTDPRLLLDRTPSRLSTPRNSNHDLASSPIEIQLKGGKVAVILLTESLCALSRLPYLPCREVASSDQSLDTWLSRAHVLSLVSPLRLVSIRHLALLLFVPFSSCLTCRFDTCLTCLTSFFCSPRLVRKCRFDTRLTRLVCPFPRVARVEFDGSLTSERTRDPREPRHVRHEPPPRELRWARSRGSRATPCPTCHVPPVITVLVSSGGPAHVAHVRHVPLLASSGRLAHVAHVRHVPLLASSGGLAHVAHVRHFIFVF